eukprot:10345964-Karenia_brevis.AAC.1
MDEAKGKGASSSGDNPQGNVALGKVDPIIERVRSEMRDNFDPNEFASRYAAIAAEVDAKEESEYFSGASSDDAKTS